MGNDSPAEANENVVGEVELALVSGLEETTGESSPLRTNEGRLKTYSEAPSGDALTDALQDVGTDELRTLLFGPDAAGDLQQVNVEALDTAVAATDIGQLTYLARALNSQDLDEFITRVTDSAGTQIDPLNQDALQSVANDELRSRLHDSAGTQIDPLNQDALLSVGNDSLRALPVAYATDGQVKTTALAAMDTDAFPQMPGFITYQSRALNTIGHDELVSRLTDSAGTQIDPLNQDVLETVAADELRSRLHDSTGTQIDPARKATHDTVYTSIDLNTAATTPVYDPATEAEVDGIHLNHGGSTAELRLEVTDGTNVSVLQDSAAGEPIHYPDPLHLNADDSLQVVVEVVEGAALTETASVSREEY